MDKIEKLIEDGMTEKYAIKYMKRIMEDEKIEGYNNKYVQWAHSKGFSAFFAYAYQINKGNYKEYISDYMCYKLYPMNDWERIWIDDKMTLHYMMANNKFDKYMPKYYYYVDKKRGLVRLYDHPLYNNYQKNENDVILDIIDREKNLAFKPNNGALSKGFIKITKIDDKIMFNDEIVDRKKVDEKLKDFPNYILTEYFLPAKPIDFFDGNVPVIKVWTLNKNAKGAIITDSVVRISENVIEYGLSFEADKKMIYANCDINTGKISEFKEIYYNKVESIIEYKGRKLQGIFLPDIKTLSKLAVDIANYLGLIECMELDFVLSNSGYKLIEINSFLCEVGMQLYHPLSIKTEMGLYFREKLGMISHN